MDSFEKEKMEFLHYYFGKTFKMYKLIQNRVIKSYFKVRR
ncbi:hypothetical protein LEP1GSC103_2201 [Leptospira borgpetersenii serovar Javanica str. UI 09931]|uniref:Uncharacterized protein n=5 Tax=Leptospira borgpetersenii TaxID=174 RepID=M3F8M2_LEPBO|nr:hypothetical protein LBBP_03712 [Leptospira borgpetersenii serovar Ballum]EKP12800.1 hypothetical protein LEP1GSC128_3952 [Leptospira borgpetersenii str. 200801926]EKQ93907.1 hypothetical protein LEP1GSC101_1704 [Leptospira borgpetersenii str. UI 09149]EKR00186.1 hypothetical protein LEP1GSC121_3633 [Leptospira borgpetersenii serovar Castellonis str. 200801910]EMF98267.1 hypothetical protein LEP1GSC123_1719 [Leptospira borgpetersenii str. 200701203]EMK11652.1 hypothetical protein LEP1GSC066